jgi:transposase
VAQGRAKLATCLAGLLDTDADASLTPRMRALVAEVRERWQDLDRRIAALDAEFAEQARINEDARRLTTIPGIGALNATALVAAIGDVASFARGRDLAAWLGPVPRQVTTGGKPRLVGITKRGSKYLRKTLVQGARAALPSLRQSDTHLGQWLRGLLARSHVNTAVVALAAKMARIVWALLRHGRVYEPAAVTA